MTTRRRLGLLASLLLGWTFEPLPTLGYAPETEAELLAALEEIGGDGEGIDLSALGLAFDEPATDGGGEAGEPAEPEEA